MVILPLSNVLDIGPLYDIFDILYHKALFSAINITVTVEWIIFKFCVVNEMSVVYSIICRLLITYTQCNAN